MGFDRTLSVIAAGHVVNDPEVGIHWWVAYDLLKREQGH